MKTTLIAITGIALILNFSCKSKHRCKGVYDGDYVFIHEYARMQWAIGRIEIKIEGDELTIYTGGLIDYSPNIAKYDCRQSDRRVIFYGKEASPDTLNFNSDSTFEYLSSEFTKIQ